MDWGCDVIAIWMMPARNAYGTWPASGEIDIVESRGNLDLSLDGVQIGTQQVRPSCLSLFVTGCDLRSSRSCRWDRPCTSGRSGRRTDSTWPTSSGTWHRDTTTHSIFTDSNGLLVRFRSGLLRSFGGMGSTCVHVICRLHKVCSGWHRVGDGHARR